MSFSESDYAAAAARLDVPIAHVKAVADVESAGETMWRIGNEMLPPVRLEAHWFGKLTGYRFNDSHPVLSCREWNPALAATSRAGAWAHLRQAEELDRDAADQATSWGAFQTMGFHWERLGFDSIAAFVEDMDSPSEQMDTFCRFIEKDPALHASLAIGAWRDVENRYNGGGYGGAYAVRLEARAAFYGSNGFKVPAPLRVGATGEGVRQLESALGLLPRGVFDSTLDAKVRAFQASKGLVADGVVGPFTRAALGI